MKLISAFFLTMILFVSAASAYEREPNQETLNFIQTTSANSRVVYLLRVDGALSVQEVCADPSLNADGVVMLNTGGTNTYTVCGD